MARLFERIHSSLPRVAQLVTTRQVIKMLLVRNLLDHIALAIESLIWSTVDWFAVQELTKCLKPVYDTITAIQQKKLSTGEFFDEK